MSCFVRGLAGCLIAPITSAVSGPIIYLGLWVYTSWTGSPDASSWDWSEPINFYRGVAVICLPALLITYMVFHFFLRPQIAGHYKNPRRTLALAGGGGLVCIFLVAMVAVSLTYSDDRWVSAEFLRRFLRNPPGVLLTLSILVISSLVLGFLAGVFLPKNHLQAEPDRSPSPFGRRLFVSCLTLMVLLCAMWAPMFYLWKRSSDRLGCIMNIRNVQLAMRSYQGMNNSEPAPKDMLVGPGRFMESEPVCPRGGKYTWAQVGWHVGELMLHCSCKDHIPDDFRDW